MFHYSLATRDGSLKEELRKEIEEKLNSIKKVAIEDTIARVATRVSQTPFSLVVSAVSMPFRFFVPTIKSFDGRANPEEHVPQYLQKTRLEIDDELLMCSFFPFSLLGSTLYSFHSLKPGSISSFNDLIQSFILHNFDDKNVRINLSTLFGTSQGKTESLHDFVSRFNEKMIRIENFEEVRSLIGIAFKKALMKGSLPHCNLVKHDIEELIKFFLKLKNMFRIEGIQRKKPSPWIAIIYTIRSKNSKVLIG